MTLSSLKRKYKDYIYNFLIVISYNCSLNKDTSEIMFASVF